MYKHLIKILFPLVGLTLPLIVNADTLENGVLTVTDLSRRYSDRTDIETIIFPDGFSTVRFAAFMNCTNLKNVIFLGTIPHFNEAAFNGCFNIERVEIQPEYLASWCVSGSDYNYDHPYGTNLYLGNTPVTTLEIPESVNSIYPYAFYGFKNITSLKFPNHPMTIQTDGLPSSLKSIYCTTLENWCNSNFDCRLFYSGAQLYINNKALSSKLEIPSTVKRLGSMCFCGNETLEEVTLPITLSDIGYAAFQACPNLKKLTINTPNIGFQDNLFFNCSALEELVVNSGNVISGGEKFLTKTKLKKIYLNNSAIAEDAEITLDYVEDVYVDNLSLWCENMSLLNKNSTLHINNEIPEQVIIPDGVIAISDRAFLKQDYTLIEIPGSVSSIGAYAMSDVKNVTCHASTPPTITATTFSNVDKTTAVLTVPKNCGGAYRTAQYWDEFENIEESTFGLNIPATAVTLSQTSLVLHVGETAELKALIMPLNATDDFIWESSDVNIATVDNGIITPNAPGIATINVQSLTTPSISASCDIRVIQNVATISIPCETVNITVGEDYTLEFVVLPDNASNKTLKWKTSDEYVATVSELGIVHGVGRGSAVITATATDDSGVSARCTIIVTGASGVDNDSLADLIIYVSDSIIHCNNVPANTAVEIYQLDGTELFVGESDSSTISFKPTNRGVYIVVVGNVSEKVVVR